MCWASVSPENVVFVWISIYIVIFTAEQTLHLSVTLISAFLKLSAYQLGWLTRCKYVPLSVVFAAFDTEHWSQMNEV